MESKDQAELKGFLMSLPPEGGSIKRIILNLVHDRDYSLRRSERRLEALKTCEINVRASEKKLYHANEKNRDTIKSLETRVLRAEIATQELRKELYEAHLEFKKEGSNNPDPCACRYCIYYREHNEVN